MRERMRINRDGLVGIGTSVPGASLELKTVTNSTGTYKVNKWSNSHHDGYFLELQTIWNSRGINHLLFRNLIMWNTIPYLFSRVE